MVGCLTVTRLISGYGDVWHNIKVIYLEGLAYIHYSRFAHFSGRKLEGLPRGKSVNYKIMNV